jgi:hypothetical protein
MKASALSSLIVLALCNVSEAFPQPVERATCTTQAVRREWSTLTAGQKANYISAVGDILSCIFLSIVETTLTGCRCNA